MFSHVTIGTNDLPRAEAFYAALFTALGVRLRFRDEAAGMVGWQPTDAERPLFILMRPFDGASAAPGNGAMTAFLAESRAVVDRCHAAALAHGGVCEGPPGLRSHYHPAYYGAYIRDPDGNKLCVCCHRDE